METKAKVKTIKVGRDFKRNKRRFIFHSFYFQMDMPKQVRHDSALFLGSFLIKKRDVFTLRPCFFAPLHETLKGECDVSM